jgi:sterol desaturase/sphingolipid hydroxylase (fatty acid hydroxylase superfamily)
MRLLHWLVESAVSRGWLERNSSGAVDRVRMKDLKFMASFVLVTGLLATSIQYFLFLGRRHLFSHKNLHAFRRFHAGHHQSQSKVHVAVAFYSNTLWDYPLHSGIALSVGVSLLIVATGRYPVGTIVYALSVYVLGLAATHSGVRETPGVKWALRVILLPIKIVPTAIRLEDHVRHHAQSNCNYGVFFSHWDRLLGTWKPGEDGEAMEKVGPTPASA